MLWYYIERAMATLFTVSAGILVLISAISLTEYFSENSTSKEIETTTAQPIYQQQIGDEADPDILIIYEAEVDGVKVYPSVIKEAK
ncbi:hypothetical protein ACN2AU_04725 [Aerococcus viridans]